MLSIISSFRDDVFDDPDPLVWMLNGMVSSRVNHIKMCQYWWKLDQVEEMGFGGALDIW